MWLLHFFRFFVFCFNITLYFYLMKTTLLLVSPRPPPPPPLPPSLPLCPPYPPYISSACGEFNSTKPDAHSIKIAKADTAMPHKILSCELQQCFEYRSIHCCRSCIILTCRSCCVLQRGWLPWGLRREVVMVGGGRLVGREAGKERFDVFWRHPYTPSLPLLPGICWLLRNVASSLMLISWALPIIQGYRITHK